MGDLLNELRCSNCGGFDLVMSDGLLVCQYCGAKYRPGSMTRELTEEELRRQREKELAKLDRLLDLIDEKDKADAELSSLERDLRILKDQKALGESEGFSVGGLFETDTGERKRAELLAANGKKIDKTHKAIYFIALAILATLAVPLLIFAVTALPGAGTGTEDFLEYSLYGAVLSGLAFLLIPRNFIKPVAKVAAIAAAVLFALSLIPFFAKGIRDGKIRLSGQGATGAGIVYEESEEERLSRTASVFEMKEAGK